MMSKNFLVIFFALAGCVSVFAQELISPDIIIKSVDRSMDLSSQLVKVSCKINLENAGKSSVKKFLFSVEPGVAEKVAYIGSVSGDSAKTPLRVTPTRVQGRSEVFWNVDLKEALQPGKFMNVEVEYVVTDSLTPHPTAILQKEKQLVKYNGNHHVYLPYPSAKQTTTINLGTRNIESYSKLNPVTASDSTLTYGPYQQVSPFSVEPMTLHYENNSPFLKVARIERVIEVSHWGNIAVEETIDLLHTGATLKGPFSRYEFQRETLSGFSSIKSFKTILPAAASDVYYRDEIGNISTSHMKMLSDSVELDLRPRFPLFGGWKTHYVLGYNVPSYEYLYSSGDNYKLRMRLIDHIYDDMFVEQLVTKVILPEGSQNIGLSTPYPVRRLPDTLHSTYLDTKGRPVITITKSNLVENHIQDFDVDYEFPRILMLREPLLVVLALHILFLMVIVYVRLDFSISKDEASESRMRASGFLDKILLRQDNRANTYVQIDDQLNKLKTSKDVNAYFNAVKNISTDHKNETAKISDLLQKVKVDAPEVADKLSELQKLDKTLKDIYAQKQALYVDKLVPGKIGRAQFVDAETLLNKKKDDIQEKINSLLKSLH